MLRRATAPANVFKITEVAEDIEKEMARIAPHRTEPVVYGTPSPPLPAYVEHLPGVGEVGNLSAEAIVRDFEATAKEIEAMGEVVKDMVRRCEQLTASASAMLDDIKSTAVRYREEGKRIFNEIESCSATTDDVRRLCGTFRDKITTRAAEAVT
jgi:hypothetical protein